ncbi:hypothetical protein CBOM_07426 [Ceraceosorus bombacis]|uniref:Uncharacterized protein n=1 Tax=Ceraceosorus bombacis TaxID=401625 RepID=A0A0P1BC59_9BASI|nr:hypothetical protein CBOM_07426 [Ceraceosorus bombacis]
MGDVAAADIGGGCCAIICSSIYYWFSLHACGANCTACDACCRCNCCWDAGEYDREDQEAGRVRRDVAGRKGTKDSEQLPAYKAQEPMSVVKPADEQNAEAASVVKQATSCNIAPTQTAETDVSPAAPTQQS